MLDWLRTPRRLAALALTAAAACALSASGAAAYSTPEAYAERTVAGGGGGRWFTGSPAEGYGCNVCHSGAPGQPKFPLYVAGLPLSGYQLGTRQEIVLSWPQMAARWRELRPDPTMPPPVDAPTPAMGMVAELVAESGKASGVIEIDAGRAGPAELCEMTRPNLKPRLAAKLYQVRPGIPPLLVKPDSTGLSRCEARQLGQRCIVALTSCGAQEVRMRWTTPITWQGPIWFSAGFVATEALSGDYLNDSVEQVAIPMLQAGAATTQYQRALRSGCGLARPAASPSPGPLLAGLACVAALLAWRRRRLP